MKTRMTLVAIRRGQRDVIDGLLQRLEGARAPARSRYTTMMRMGTTAIAAANGTSPACPSFCWMTLPRKIVFVMSAGAM